MLMNVDDKDCRRLEISHRLICFTILSPKVMTNFCNLESLFFLITYFFSDFGFLWSVLFGRSFFYFVRLFTVKSTLGVFITDVFKSVLFVVSVLRKCFFSTGVTFSSVIFFLSCGLIAVVCITLLFYETWFIN